MKILIKNILFLIFLFALSSCAREEDKTLQPYNSPKSDALQIGSTDDIIIEEPPKVKKVKVYIENSLSMYGYIPDQRQVITTFRDAVNELFIYSKHAYPGADTELYLINNETTVEVPTTDNLNGVDSTTLEKKYYKGRGNSDFDKLFGNIMSDWKPNDVVVFIADFIYSPGNNDVSSGLNRLRQNITETFLKAQDAESLAINILHLESDFHGIYYDIHNNKINGVKNRPYYMFIIGDEKNISDYSEEITSKLERYKLQNKYFLSNSIIPINHYSALPYTLNTGQFESKNTAIGSSQIKEVIVKNSVNHKTNLQLTVSIDLKDIPVPERYLTDIDNYVLNDKKVELIDVRKIEDNRIELTEGKSSVISPSDMGNVKSSTHALLLSFPSSYKGNIEISLKKLILEWVKEVSFKDGEDDIDIKSNILKQSQSFGFDYIVEGIYDAQKLKNQKNEYFRITLDIDQEKSGSGLGAIIGWLIGLGIIGIIIFIIIRNKQRK